MHKLVSVIVPTYKRPKGLSEAIDSVLNQSYKNIEIIIVDDNNTDSMDRKETKLIVKEYKNNYNNIVYIEQPSNLGGAYARNTGIRVANGKYVAFLDDDDEYNKDHIAKAVLSIENSDNNRVGFVISEMEYNYGSGIKKITNRSELLFGKRSQLKSHLLKVAKNGFVGTPTFLFKKKVLDDVGGFQDVSIRQEYCLLLKILGQGYQGVYSDHISTIVNVSNDGVTNNYSLKKENDFLFIYQLQLNYSAELNKKEKYLMKLFLYIDLLKFLYLSKNYQRLIINCFKFFNVPIK